MNINSGPLLTGKLNLFNAYVAEISTADRVGLLRELNNELRFATAHSPELEPRDTDKKMRRVEEEWKRCIWQREGPRGQRK